MNTIQSLKRQLLETEETVSTIMASNLSLQKELSLLRSLVGNNDREYNSMTLNLHEANLHLRGLHESDTFASYWRKQYRTQIDINTRLIAVRN